MERRREDVRSRQSLRGYTLVVLALACREAASSSFRPADDERVPRYAEARAVVNGHCVGCHSARPSIAAFPIAPAGVALDTPAQMQQHAARIRARTLVDRTMPLLNKTGMTDRERDLLARWVEGGAKGP